MSADINVRPKSLSSSLMMVINLYRNKPGVFNKAQAQIAYPMVAAAAIVESVVASIFTILSTLSLPFSKNNFNYCTTWLKSSTFTIMWSLADFLINPFCFVVVADEKSAKSIARAGDLMWLPFDAIV